MAADPKQYVQSLLTGAASPQALAAIEPELKQQGITLQRDSSGNVRGRLYLPSTNGDPYSNAIDVVGPNGWGGAWQWIDRAGGGDGGGGGPRVLPRAGVNVNRPMSTSTPLSLPMTPTGITTDPTVDPYAYDGLPRRAVPRGLGALGSIFSYGE